MIVKNPWELLNSFWKKVTLIVTVISGIVYGVFWLVDHINYHIDHRIAIGIDAYKTVADAKTDSILKSSHKYFQDQVDFLEKRCQENRKQGNMTVAGLIEEMDSEEYNTKYGKVIIEHTNGLDYWYPVWYEGTDLTKHEDHKWDLFVPWSAHHKKKKNAFGYFGWKGDDDWIWIKEKKE